MTTNLTDLVRLRLEYEERITALTARAEKAEKMMALMGERAVVDFDDAAAGMVDSVVPWGTYGEWVKMVLDRAMARRPDSAHSSPSISKEFP